MWATDVINNPEDIMPDSNNSFYINDLYLKMCQKSFPLIKYIAPMDIDDVFTLTNIYGAPSAKGYSLSLNYGSPTSDEFQIYQVQHLFRLLDGMKPIEFINRLESEMAKERGYGVYWKQFKTFPQLVLAFVMQHVHSLRWNDDQDDWKPYSPTRDTPYRDDS